MPRGIRPMLATAGKPFDSLRHRFEIKWDGIRALAYLEHADFWLETRNLKPALPRFPELEALKESIAARSAILDGEIVVLGDDGAPDFDLVRSRNAQKSPRAIHAASRATPAIYIAFDALYRDGKALFDEPLAARLEQLEAIVRPGERILLSQGIVGAGKAYFQAAAARNLEGVVGKDLESPYLPGVRSPHWIKVRNVKQADCVIGGFVPKGSALIKSLIVGLYDPHGHLHYIGHVGTGFTEKENALLRSALATLETRVAPFAAIPAEALRGATWVEPRLVCTVEYLTLTAAGHLRHPTFRRLRADKEPEACLITSELEERSAHA